jgi:transposase
MAIDLRAADRDQLLLMPPSVADWLPEDHLAWFIIDVVAELDLSDFYASYRADGRGGATYDPAFMLSTLFYAYATGERSSRRIERRLVDDVGFRVVAANQTPDHATLARFRRRHEEAIAELFAQVLGLCVESGLVDSSVISIDGTKIEANASAWANRTRRQLAEEILAEAENADQADDEAFGERRGDELPGQFAPGADRRARLREALRQLDSQGAADHEAHLAQRAQREAELGHKFPGRKPSPEGAQSKERLANVTDPDSRMLRARNRFLQGYNAQAAVSADQIVVAAEITNAANDTTMFVPMLDATERHLGDAGAVAPGVIAADTGYWSAENLAHRIDAEVLIPPMPNTKGQLDDHDPRLALRESVLSRVEAGELDRRSAAEALGVSDTQVNKLLANRRRGIGDPAILRSQMLERLKSDEARAHYAVRKITVEPVFGNIKANLRFRKFSGRGIEAVRSEWRLICSVHNLLKLKRAAIGT